MRLPGLISRDLLSEMEEAGKQPNPPNGIVRAAPIPSRPETEEEERPEPGSVELTYTIIYTIY